MKHQYLLLILLIIITFTSCEKVDNTSLKGYRVDIDLRMKSVWDTYGCPGLGDWRYFNRAKKLPANFPYTANSYTGLGGVIIFYSNNGIVAFEAACPVERKADYVVAVDDKGNYDAVCPKCGSRYDVFQGTGVALSGEAINRRVALNRYNVYYDKTTYGYRITSF